MAWRDWLAKFLGVGDPRQIEAASSSPVPVRPGYPTQSSMSAMAAFPWVRACVLAIVDDLSGLPLIAVETEADGDRLQRPDHPVLQLLRRPSDRVTGRRLRRQALADFVLTGNAYLYLPDPALMRIGLSPLMRLHPGLVTVEVDPMGLPVGYTYNSRDSYALDQVLHVADVSWSDDERQILGESAIRTLHDDLTSHKAAKEHAARAAKRGRPEFLISPKDANVGWGQKGAEKIVVEMESALGKGYGAIAFNEALDVMPLMLTSRDLEFAEQHEQTIYAILAVFGVPPVRVGLPGANYGTAKTQMRAYWETLQHKAALFDDELSRLTGSSTVRIEHDFTGVDALQVARTERLERVATWAAMGFDPVDAARHEGFINPPRMGEPTPAPDMADRRRPAQQPEEPQGTRRTLREDVGAYLHEAAKRYTAAVRKFDADPTQFDLRASEAERLTVVLEQHMDEGRARSVAESIARQMGDAVAEHLVEAAANDIHPIDVRTLAAFGRRFADRVTGALEAAS